MSKTIEISRELLQKLDDLLYIMTGHDSHPKLIRKYGEEWWSPLDAMRAEICTALAAPVVERQDILYQVRAHGSCCWEDISGESLEMCQCQPEEYEIRKLYISPPAPVAVVLPKDPEKSFLEWASTLPSPPRCLQSYLAAIDKVKELNQ